ncbi:MAG: polyprenyl synthetase family protein [Polyangiales bacterium]
MMSAPSPLASPASPERSPEESARALIDAVRPRVDARLFEHLSRARVRAAEASRSAEALVEAIEALVRRGGKRFRPTLTLVGWSACGGGAVHEANAGVLDVACSWELLQAYFLVHDDWMDGDVTRRGGPAVHVALAEAHGDAHLGAAAAILAGDFASALAHRVLLDAALPAATLHAAAAAFARVHEEVVLGQAIDLALGAADAAAIERMHALKTGSYTVRGPLELGAILAGAAPEPRAALARYAAPIGVAFQLRDDLLGTFGDERETGKPVGGDLRARKRTSLIGEARARCTGADAARLDRLLDGGGTASEDDVRWAMELVERCGARAAIERRLESLIVEGSAAARDPSLAREAADVLIGLARLLGWRRA